MEQKIFISSTYTENKKLRLRIAHCIKKEGHFPKLAEPTEKTPGFIDKKAFPEPDTIEISDKCLEELSTSDGIVGVLSGDLGSKVIWIDSVCRARHFELEILSAVLQQKPIMLLSDSGFSPDTQLKAFVECVIGVQGVVHYVCRSESEMLEKIKEFCNAPLGYQSRKAPYANSSPLIKTGGLVQGLAFKRADFASVNRHKMLLPFVGWVPDEKQPADLELAHELIQSGKSIDNLHIRFGRLWMAFRELLPSHPAVTQDQLVLKAWNELLGAWLGSASWYSLHAHAYLGSLAIATGLWNVRSRYRELAPKNENTIDMPVGGVASANYSLIKQLPNPVARYYANRSLRRFIDRNREQQKKDSGVLLIRGNVNLELLQPFAAERDFRLGLKQYEAAGAPERQLGDVRVQLATALAAQLKIVSAGKLAERGIEMMEKGAGKGPMLRALRKAIRIESLPFGDKDRLQHYKTLAQKLLGQDGYLDQYKHFR